MDDLFDRNDINRNREFWERIIDEEIEKMYGENPQGIDKEELKKEMMERHGYSMDSKGMSGEFFAICILA